MEKNNNLERKTALDTAVGTIAAAMGVSPDEITTGNPAWVKLMKEGVVASITLRRWRATTRLHFDDLGLPMKQREREAFGAIMELGDKYLLPQEIIKELASIDAAARTNLKRYGYDTYWGVFIPVTAFAEWLEKDQQYEARYMAVRDNIVENWDKHLATLLNDYAAQARTAWRTLRQLDKSKMTLAEYDKEDLFVDRFIARVTALLPTPEYVGASFSYERQLRYIPLPDLLAKEEADAKVYRAEAQAAIELNEQIKAAARSQAEVARREANAKIGAVREAEALESARLAKEHNLKLAALENEADAVAMRKAMLLEMNSHIVEQARKEKEQLISSFLADTVAALRETVYEAVTDVAATLQNSNYVHPRSVKQLQNLLERVGQLNFTGDAEIAAIIAPVKELLQQQPKDRNAEEFSKQLTNIAKVTRQQLLALGRNPRSGKELGIPDRISGDELRQARASLGLTDTSIAPAMEKRKARTKRAAVPKPSL